MGRYVRPVLRALAARPEIELTLLVREPQRAAAYRAIVGDGIAVEALAAARARGRFDCAWFPWNGMRFASAAPAVVTINDDFAFAYPAAGFVARRREQQPIRTAIREAARIATISTWSRDRLVERFGLDAGRISILPLAPDAYFTPGSENSPSFEPFVLTVGAGEARKNVGFLIDAVGRAFPAGNIRLIIVGKPEPAARAILRSARFPIETRAAVDDRELRTLYRTAAVVAVPSLAEGFGLVAAEAQACGAAVIAADGSALPEAVGAAGRLVDPRDADAWCAALRDLLEHPAEAARYRRLAADRWKFSSSQRTTDALTAAFERAIHDRV